jgi:hypothetical protein
MLIIDAVDPRRALGVGWVPGVVDGFGDDLIVVASDYSHWDGE